MRKKNIVKKFFRSNPEKLKVLKSEIDQISGDNFQLNDNDIPSFDQFLARNKSIAKYYENNKKDRSRHWYKRKTILIPISTVLFLFFFISFTTPGKAMAENICNTVVQWFGNGVDIRYGYSETPGNCPTLSPEYYDSSKDVESKYNVKYVYNSLSNNNGQIEVDPITDTSYVIKTTYILDLKKINVTQTVYGNNTSMDSTIKYGDNAKIIKITLDNGMQFVGYVDNGVGYAIAYLNQSSIEIYAENIDYTSFNDFINGLEINN